MITINNAEDVLKDYYLDVVKAQLNAEVSPFYNAIAKTSENVYGKQVRMTVVRSNMDSIKACGESDDLPTPHTNRFYDIVQPLKNIYGTIELSDKLIRASADSSGALVNMINAEMEGIIADAKTNLARMLYGNEDGKVTSVVRKVTSTTLEVVDAKPYLLYQPVTIQSGGSTFAAIITKINRDTNVITVNTNLDSYTFSGGEQIFLQNVTGKELKGLSYIFDGSILYGYTKSAIPFFNPYVASVTRSELSEDDLIRVVDELEENSGGKINMILCSYKTKRLIAQLFEGTKQIVNSTDIQAGCTNIYVNTVPVYADAFCPEGRIYFLNTNDFVLCQLCDWSWLENESGKVLTQVAGKAAFSATLVKYAELICKRPCGQGLLRLTD